jgi:hypothetical protein
VQCPAGEKKTYITSHHGANTAIAFFVAAVAAEAWFLDGFDGFLDGGAGAGGWEDEVDGRGDGGGAHFGLFICLLVD